MSSVRRLFNRTARPIYVGGRSAAIGVLERRHGIRTEAEIELDELGVHREGLSRYKAAGWFTLRRALRPGEVGREDVFVDIGCGMGRVVFQAAHGYPFKRVLGIDLAADLVAVATKNVDRNRHRLRCSDVQLFVADVVEWELPDDVTVVYLNNPFLGSVFDAFLAQLFASLERAPRPIRFIYSNPIEHDRLMATGRFRITRRLRGLRPEAEWSRSNSTIAYDLR